nr:hypothetical protein [Tanacetum cinerariifolium]
MVDFVPDRAVIDAVHRKWVKYEAKCADTGYGFLPFSFSLLGELEKDAGSFVSPPDSDDGVVRFVLYDLTKPQVSSCSLQINHAEDLLPDQHGGFTLALLNSLFSKGLRTIKSIPPKCRLRFSRVLKGALVKVICKPDDISCWVSLLVLPLYLLKTFFSRSNVECESSIKRQRQEESIANAIRSWSVSGGSLQLSKHLFKPAPLLPLIPIYHNHFIASPSLVLDKIKSFPRGTSCGRDGFSAHHLLDCLSGAFVAISDKLVSSITQVVNLFLEGKCPKILGEYIASAPLTLLVKPGGGIRSIAVGTVWSSVSGGGEAILHVVNRLIEDRGDDVGLSMLLVDFKNAFNLVDREAWYLDDDTIVGDTLVVRNILELILKDGPLALGPTFDDALCVFNMKMETSLLSNPGEIDAPKLMKKLTYIYFTRVTQIAESTFSLSPRQIALWQSQMEDHRSDSLKVVPISGLGQTMNGSLRGIFMEIMLYHVSVSLLLNIGITLCMIPLSTFVFGQGFGLDRGLDVCMDLTWSSPLTQTGLTDFLPGRAVVDAAHRKRVKYEAKCADIRYGFLPFSFSSFKELEEDAVTLLKRFRKFSVVQDIRARAAVYIFSRISFVIARGVRAQIVSRLPNNFL